MRDRIHIIAEKNAGKLELRIEDNGNGYPVEILQGGGNSVRSVDFQGGSTSLGCYFAAIVARMHHNQKYVCELKLENGGSLKGARFVLLLP